MSNDFFRNQPETESTIDRLMRNHARDDGTNCSGAVTRIGHGDRENINRHEASIDQRESIEDASAGCIRDIYARNDRHELFPVARVEKTAPNLDLVKIQEDGSAKTFIYRDPNRPASLGLRMMRAIGSFLAKFGTEIGETIALFFK